MLYTWEQKCWVIRCVYLQLYFQPQIRHTEFSKVFEICFLKLFYNLQSHQQYIRISFAPCLFNIQYFQTFRQISLQKIQKALFYRDNDVIFLLMLQIVSIDFPNVKPTLYSWNKPSWVMMYNPLQLFAEILFRVFASVLTSELGLNFPFSTDVVGVLVTSLYQPLLFLLSWIFGMRIALFFLKYLAELTPEGIWVWSVFVESLLFLFFL